MQNIPIEHQLEYITFSMQCICIFRDASDYESDTEDDAKLAKASQNKK